MSAHYRFDVRVAAPAEADDELEIVGRVAGRVQDMLDELNRETGMVFTVGEVWRS